MEHDGGSESVSCSVVSNSLQLHSLQPARLLCPWNSPGKNTGMGSHSLFQGFFWTQRSNPGLLHCRWILYHLNHLRSVSQQNISYEKLSSKFKVNPVICLYLFQLCASCIPWWLSVKEPACSAGDLGSIPGSGRSPGEGNGNPLLYSCLDNCMDRGAWRATVHAVIESWTWLSD